MEIIVNSESHTVQDKLSLAGLVEELGLGDAPVAAEVNKELVPKRQHADRILQQGDRIELVTLVGGG